ncbi:unnamed protein product [Calicophoron daubneyi]|uniref:Uncharacterized protein n=1 Tax=Calicophoron daubneyi TaxID=300641 RepID=A0AAV2TT51_CALDB
MAGDSLWHSVYREKSDQLASLRARNACASLKQRYNVLSESLAMPGLWIAAAGQNAFDTGAGMSVLMTYAAFTGRSASITKYSIFIPLVNNLVSFYASITIFCTVFSTMIMTNPTITRAAIVRIMQTTGPGSTGLTFTWIPVLFSKVGILGRILCTLFFLCLAFAGVSSLLSEIQAYVLALKEMGVSHRIAVSGALIATFLIGIPSALSLEFLDNQDNTWGYALIICGFLLAIVVIIYRPLRFRRIIINEFGTNDWNAPIIWVPIITVLVPAIAIILIVWWIYDYIRADSHWYHLTLASVTSMILEWLILLVLLVGTNLLVYYCRRDFYTKARKIGCDPYDPTTYEKAESLKLKEIKVAAVNGNGVVNRNES